MGKVIWSPSALKDVDSIAEYIARDSTDQASLFVVRLLEATDRLQNFLSLAASSLKLTIRPVVKLFTVLIALCIGSMMMKSGLPVLYMVPVIGTPNNLLSSRSS